MKDFPATLQCKNVVDGFHAMRFEDSFFIVDEETNEPVGLKYYFSILSESPSSNQTAILTISDLDGCCTFTKFVNACKDGMTVAVFRNGRIIKFLPYRNQEIQNENLS